MVDDGFDLEDPLRGYRGRFYDSGESLIYLDGNSLGRMPLGARERMGEVVDEEWGSRLIRSWNEGWLDLNERIAKKIARLIGARENEVLVTDSTSMNLFKLAYAALKVQGEDRDEIVSDELNFPSDLYVLQGLNDLLSSRYRIHLAKSHNGQEVSEQEIAALMNERTALLTLSHVCFKSGFLYDMSRITRLAHDQGALVIWDLSHAAGAVQVDLNQADADMAVGCTYKYLNGGPGSLAFLYVREDLQNSLTNPVWAWLADENPFGFGLDYRPATGIRRFATSTPPILSLSALEPGVDLLLEAGMDRIREKSIRLGNRLIELFDEKLAPLGFTLGSPRQADKRGSHVSVRHPEGYRIARALTEPLADRPVIIPDFRKPDFIRLGLTPLYTRYADVALAVDRICEIVETQEYQRFQATPDDGMVT